MVKHDMEARIRYVEDWNGRGEHYLFEIRHKGGEWGLDRAFRLLDSDITGEKGVLLSYTALTTIRRWKELGIEFTFE